MAKAKRPVYRLTERGLAAIAAGEFRPDGRTASHYSQGLYVCRVAIGRDHSMEVKVYEDAILAHPDWFEEIVSLTEGSIEAVLVEVAKDGRSLRRSELRGPTTAS